MATTACSKSTTIAFTKMHGAGNDYIYVNAMLNRIDDPAAAARLWSAPHTGIGADGLVLIGCSDRADFSMRIFNADGSEALMCGNASRCIGKYVYEHGLTDKTSITLDTLSGIKHIKLHTEGGKVKSVTVDMGKPEIMRIGTPEGQPMIEQAVTAAGMTFTATAVSMGNPHLVIFTDDLDSIDIAAAGRELEHHPAFVDRTNVEFAQPMPGKAFRMRVWERGSGITQACGTGACATAVAAMATGRGNGHSDIVMDGGTLSIAIDGDSGHVMMTGDAVEVFNGQIEWQRAKNDCKHKD